MTRRVKATEYSVSTAPTAHIAAACLSLPACLHAGLGRENGTNKHTQSWIVHAVKICFCSACFGTACSWLTRIAVKISVFQPNEQNKTDRAIE